VLGAELAQPRRADFLARLDQDLQVEAQPAVAGAQDLLERGQVDRVLALVVRGAAAVPAILADSHVPRIEPGAPPAGLGEHHVGVTVGQDRRQPVRLVPARDQERAAAAVVRDAGGGAQPACGRNHFLLQVSEQVRAAPGRGTLSREGDPAAEVGQEPAGVEVVSGGGDGQGSGHPLSRSPGPGRWQGLHQHRARPRPGLGPGPAGGAGHADGLATLIP
jgi:hypothetical protein